MDDQKPSMVRFSLLVHKIRGVPFASKGLSKRGSKDKLIPFSLVVPCRKAKKKMPVLRLCSGTMIVFAPFGENFCLWRANIQ
jgi:hypothetical protein